MKHILGNYQNYKILGNYQNKLSIYQKILDEKSEKSREIFAIFCWIMKKIWNYRLPIINFSKLYQMHLQASHNYFFITIK